MHAQTPALLPPATAMTTPLRVGLLVASTRLPAWAAELIERLQALDCVEIALVVEEDPSDGAPRGLRERWRELPGMVSRRAYDMLDRRRAQPPSPFTPTDCTERLADVPRVTAQVRQTKFSDYFEPPTLEVLESARLDVMIRLGFRILRGGVLQAARFGVWSFHHGDNRVNRGGAPGFWEIYKGWGQTGTVLQILTEDLDGGRILARTVAATDMQSLARNRAQTYWKALAMVPRCLERLHRDGPARFFAQVDADDHPGLYGQPLHRTPNNVESMRFLRDMLWRSTRNAVDRRLYQEQWILLVSRRRSLSTSFWRFDRLVPPPDRFWADPHVIRRGKTWYIFIEEYLYATRTGHIACLEMDTDGATRGPYPVLQTPYHLSYPFIFEHDGRIFMMPESGAARRIDVYECVEFPRRWQLHTTLMRDVRAVDPTLYKHGDRWWLFANIAEYPGVSTSDELYVFHADDPLSETWTPHPLNPVVSDASRARPAGPLFEHGGKLYRPSQKATPRYGRGLNLNEVVVLSETEYAERLVSTVEPDWAPDLLGIHSLASAKGLTVADALIKRPRWRTSE